MLILTIKVDAPLGQAQEVKEDLAAYLERYGNARVVSIKEEGGEQMSLLTMGWDENIGG